MIETIRKACPGCGGDVKGTPGNYYCKQCNLVYTKRSLVASKEYLEHHVKKTVVRKVDKKLLKSVYADKR